MADCAGLLVGVGMLVGAGGFLLLAALAIRKLDDK
jgi:hypothetical protein